jgi:hypothetical protein
MGPSKFQLYQHRMGWRERKIAMEMEFKKVF